ncbi:MAG: hypothetical protein OHK0018_02000 [Erythrobacter tepidarius]
MTRPETALVRELEAALAFWQAAGVSHDFRDHATAWLAEAPRAPTAPGNARPAAAHHTATPAQAPAASLSAIQRDKAAPPAVAAGAPRARLLGESPPRDLASFRDWWMSAPGLAATQAFPRIAPRGEAGAELLVLVPQPEEGDREQLLGGPQGRLLANILAAMGLRDSAVYLAAALPCHTPMADLAMQAARGMDAVTAHHIALATPHKVLVLGTALTAMLGTDAAEGLREINHAHRRIPVMVSETLEAMLYSPTLKARFWRRWMEWSASN